MISKLKSLVKNNKSLYFLYYYICSFLLRLFGLFVKTDPNLILFISYGGQKYDDSPKVLYEYLLNHPVSSMHKYVWAFVSPREFPQVEHSVRVDSAAYYITALKAGYWITNSSASRGLKFKKKATKYYMFQHGMAGIKRLGRDIEQADRAFHIAFQEQFDGIFIEGKEEIDILTHAWDMPRSVFYQTGLPRNDDLTTATPEEIQMLKAKLGVPQDKKVILYAPTFREFSKSLSGQTLLSIPFHFDAWREKLGEEYVLIITAHYEVAKLTDALPTDGFVINAFKYPRINDLLKVADILISDYSSVVFDYSILERPIFCYGYDYDNYLKERGLYTDLNLLFSHGVIRSEVELLNSIINMDYHKECEYTRARIKNKYIASYGGAAEKAVEIIFSKDSSSIGGQ